MGWTDRQEVRERKEAGVVSPVYLYRSPAAWMNATELLQDRQRQVTGLILRILQFNSPYQRAPEDVSFSCFILCAVIRKCNSVYTLNNWTHLMEVNIDRGLAITGSEQVWPWGDTRLLEGKNCSWRNAFPADSCHSCFLSSLSPTAGISKISSCDWTLGHKDLALPRYSVSPVPREWKEGQVATALFVSFGL